MDFSNLDYRLIAPEVFLFLWSLIVLFISVNNKDTKPRVSGILSLIGLFIALVLTWQTPDGKLFGETFLMDSYARAFKLIFIGTAFMTLFGSIEFTCKKLIHRGEFYALIMLCTTGMMFLASAGELISMYVALELSTIALYVLATFMKRDFKSTEAGLKYLILGAASSGILLYGLSLIYGLTGTTVMSEIGIRLFIGPDTRIAAYFAIVMFIAGFGFKLAAAPFHMWAPDVYEGAPTPVTAFLSVASKAAGLVAFVRLFFEALFVAKSDWIVILEVVAILAMVIGNVVALLQTNIKRMLAYSSIAQVGYVLVALSAGIDLSVGSMMIFLLAYLFANIGAFIVVIAFSNATGSDNIADYAGLMKRSPLMALIMTIFMVSLVGIPPTAGFLAKYWMFGAAVKEGLYGLVVVAVLTSVISLFYYMNVVRLMMFRSADDDSSITIPGMVKASLIISVAMVLIICCLPGAFYDWAMSASTIFTF
ncbi:MAG: NADH-quinone oxidoreductase subunit N [candidate division Zixibacteria bacterium]|nr:NADH-quinone oxidoreductase subunit N [candidate division Zixibacteria bacterium]